MIANLRPNPSGNSDGSVLPQHTMSLCPDCLKAIPAVIDRRDECVWMSKRCPQHGEFNELISTDAAFYEKMDRWHWETDGRVANSTHASVKGCPHDCGLCPDPITFSFDQPFDHHTPNGKNGRLK